MSTYPILCSGLGPHDPPDGVLGISDRQGPHDVRCGSEACVLIRPQQPLDASGALATLLVVQGVLSIDDAANAVGVASQDLINEAQAWAVASNSLNL
jgi:hypothetical protein